MPTSPPETLGRDARFTLKRRLGAGGMGVVWAAHDRQRDQEVALKTLHERDPAALYGFKKEFRTLADVAHPNLVALYELIAEDERWFFTMELVDGVSFIDWVRPRQDAEERRQARSAEVTRTYTAGQLRASWQSARRTAADHPGTLDVERLRTALRQLASGVRALHDAGKLHRDLKPSNVLVSAAGRLVILDFGLATDRHAAIDPESRETGLAGTLSYMAPEQIEGAAPGPASDWYAVGVMLFQALTGNLPFRGPLARVLSDKLKRPAPSPRSLVPDLPADLADLCRDLLAIDPALRPAAAAILERLGEAAPARREQSWLRLEPSGGALVGRDRHLETLEQAFAASRAGRAVSIHVHGRSGMGKTDLVTTYLRRLAEERRAVVLVGRCYEREMVPFKALDGVIDSLSKYLLSIERSQAEELLPPDVHALARLFPVLLRVPALAQAERPEREAPERSVLRRRAFAALRELLRRIARRRPLVLSIDDLHWADADSTALLDELLRPPDPPPVLLITCWRSEEVAERPFLRQLLERADGERYRALEVEPLARAEIRQLAIRLLDVEGPDFEPVLHSIAREAEGSPFFTEQLASYVAALDTDLGATRHGGMRLVEMLDARLAQLPAGAGDLLSTLAAAGRPIDAAVAYRAAGLEGDERPLIGALKAARLVRSYGTGGAIELYHDRLGEALAGRLDARRARRVHRRLAAELPAAGFDDPAALVRHLTESGDRSAAARQAVHAARRAAAALAFDRAALFYRRALELGRFDAAEHRELKLGQAESLACAGRPAEAARIFLELATGSAGAEALRLRSRAAQEYLAGGYFDDGTAQLRVLLRAVGLKMPGGPRRALLSLVWQRLRLRLRGLGFRARREDQVPESELLRLDVCWMTASGFVNADTLLGNLFQTRHLLLALSVGEPRRLARALALEAVFQATAGGPARRRADRLSNAALDLARQVDEPYTTAAATLGAGLVHYMVGEWRPAAELCERAEALFEAECQGVVWELATARRFALSALYYLGELAEIRRRVPRLLAAARERGILQTAADLRTRLHVARLAEGDVDGARQEVERALARWSQQGYQLLHYNALLARTQIALYDGQADAAWRRLDGEWPRLERSRLLRFQLAAIEARFLRARAALAAAERGRRPESTRAAEDALRDIARQRMPYSAPMADQLRAALAWQAGERRRARELLAAAARGYEANGMRLYAAAARYRLGRLTGGEAGRRLEERASDWMAAQEIREPERMSAMLAPGFG